MEKLTLMGCKYFMIPAKGEKKACPMLTLDFSGEYTDKDKEVASCSGFKNLTFTLFGSDAEEVRNLAFSSVGKMCSVYHRMYKGSDGKYKDIFNEFIPEELPKK